MAFGGSEGGDAYCERSCSEEGGRRGRRGSMRRATSCTAIDLTAVHWSQSKGLIDQEARWGHWGRLDR